MRIIYITSIFILSILTQCGYSQKRSNSTVSADTIYINFQGGFNHNLAKVKINNKLISEIELSTDKILGFAKELRIHRDTVNNIKIEILKEEKIHEINIKDLRTNFIGVWFYKNELKYYFSNKPYIYE